MDFFFNLFVRIIRREQEFLYRFLTFLSSDSFQMNNSFQTVKINSHQVFKFTFGHFNEIREFFFLSKFHFLILF